MPAKLTVTQPSDFVVFGKESILQGIHQRIEERTRVYPTKSAIHAEDRTYTYAELNGYANSIAQAILSQCGAKLKQVAILLPNSAEMIASMLGSMKAHKAYVPLDCNYPLVRLRAMLEDAESAALITDSRYLELAGQLVGSRIPILNLSEIECLPDAPNPNIATDPLDRAYILYTSGTTGSPKGIAFLHRNLLHTTMCLTNQLFFSPSDRVTWLHSASFAASVVDIYCCLTNGATLNPWDFKVKGLTGMADWLIRERITTLQWIPSALRQLLRTVSEDFRFQEIRIVVMASEPLTIREVELFRQHFAPGSHLVNQVGTSESYNYHLYCIDHELPIEGVNVSGGYPVSPDRQVLILNEAHEELPKGSTGEIAIKSNYMSAGYWRNDEEARAKFIHTGGDDVPVYLTGDMGELAADGCLTHLGRKDFQIKVRGFRIEIAEVEHTLARVPGVADCACWIAKNRRGEEQLVGYIVPKLPEQFSQSEAAKFLQAQLPDYMVPRIYITLEALPYLPSGKVDRKALPSPFEHADGQEDANPQGIPLVLHKVQEIFQEILKLDRVSEATDFLSEGGDSLSVAILKHQLDVNFGVEIAMDELSDSVTPAGVAILIASAQGRAPRSSMKWADGASTQPAQISRSLLLTGDGPAPTTVEATEVRNSVSRRSASAGTKDLVIISAGRLGREIVTWATHAIAAGANYRIKGFLDDRADALAGFQYDTSILGSVESYEIRERDVFVGAIGDPRAKLAYYALILEKGGQFINVIHPSAIVGSHVRLGSGIVLAPYTVLTADVSIGDHVAIGTFSNIGHDVMIGSWCQISSHCGVNGMATLGKGVFLGSHACVIPAKKVGDWAFIGAGSVVVRDVEPGAKVFGNPAAVIGKA